MLVVLLPPVTPPVIPPVILPVTQRLLITSFAPWLAHQPANSSDQLLVELAQMPDFSPALANSVAMFRQLPVNLPVARSLTIAKFQQLRPQILLCCGMAESRQKLSLEAEAVWGDSVLRTGLDVEQLASSLPDTVVSHDAGRFVCNSLYHAMLNYVSSYPDCHALFLHVPLLTAQNRSSLVQEFRALVDLLLAKVL